jgi:hypothetical protein
MNGLKNWHGMPAHPTDQYAFFRTKEKELLEIRAKYDAVTKGMSAKRKAGLHDLIEWARSEAISDEIFSSSEGV